MSTETTSIQHVQISTLDLLEAVCLLNGALAQDAPEPEVFYLNQVMNILYGYLPSSERPKVDEYLADKKYLPPVSIEISK